MLLQMSIFFCIFASQFEKIIFGLELSNTF